MIQLTMTTFTDERESFLYTIENNTKDINQIQLLDYRNIQCFPTLYIYTLNHKPPLILPHISIHHKKSLRSHFHLITFFPS